jgi:transcriptional regulator with XRE-family HTH domain
MKADTRGDADPNLPAQRFVQLLQRLGKQGISQAQVARRANVPPQYVSDVKNIRRPLTELFARRLADEFGCNYLWILGLDDSHERPVLCLPTSPREQVLLPMLGEAISGEPREHPLWRGTYTQVSGVAAAKSARAVQPYVLQLDHGDREGRLRKGDFVLVSQATAENPELSIVRCGKKILLARKKGAKWIPASTGEPLHGDCDVTGHCLGVVWSALT